MKKITPFLLLFTILYACKKDSTSKPPSIDISNLPKEYTRYDAVNHVIYFRIYKYDSNKNLAGIYVRENDTLGGNVYVDSGSYYFNVDQTINLPTGYTSVYRKAADSKPQIETHKLYFNDKKQVIKDSGIQVISGDNPDVPTKYYSYNSNTQARESFSHAGGGWNKFQIDSLFTVSGDVRHFAQYQNGGSGNDWVVSDQSWVGFYSDYANPFYNSGLSYSFGGFLYLEGIEDFLSLHLANDPGYTFVTDSKGRVVSGAATNGSYIQIIYQN
jgi:hypothetical protein